MIRIHVCDRPEKYEQLRSDLQGAVGPKPPYLPHLPDFTMKSPTGADGITVHPDGHHVSRTSDFIMYSVEAEFIDNVVAQYGPCEC